MIKEMYEYYKSNNMNMYGLTPHIGCFIYNFGIMHEFRNKKFGSDMLKFIIIYSKEKKYKYISLHVEKSNIPAFNLYKKFNFQQIGTNIINKKENIIMRLDF